MIILDSILWTKKAQSEFFQIKNEKDKKKISKILKEIQRDTDNALLNSEPLKYEFSGAYSRKINQKDRLIFHIRED